MIELLKEFLPAWAWALVLIVLSVAGAIVTQLLAGGTWLNVLFAVLAALAPGVVGAKAIGGRTEPEVPASTGSVAP